MAGEEALDLRAFAAAYRELAEAVARLAPATEGPFVHMLRDHLGADLADLPVVSMAVDPLDHANVQRALDALIGGDDVGMVRTVGLRGEHRMFGAITLTQLTQAGLHLEVGPVDHVDLPVDVGESLPCVDFGLFLLDVGGVPYAVLVRGANPRAGAEGLSVEVMGPDRAAGTALLTRLRRLMAVHNVFRSKVVALEVSGAHMLSLTARFIERPALERSDVILPDGVLERVERMTVDFSDRAAAIRAAGSHLRRGLLLHGPPGTGKTHTVRYLLSRLVDRTVFVLSGQGLAAIGKTVGLARLLQPAVVVLEDVDLVAEERTRPHAGTNPVLFELLNHMDGVEEDADIVFVLTTNRPDLLEPALAARPGRVDLAVEVPRPAAPERLRLLQLYAKGVGSRDVDWEAVVQRTDGSSAAFLRELVRQATLSRAGQDGEIPVIDQAALDTSLAELAHASQSLTSRLLGSPAPG